MGMRRGLAAMLCAVMVLSSVPSTYVYAVEEIQEESVEEQPEFEQVGPEETELLEEDITAPEEAEAVESSEEADIPEEIPTDTDLLEVEEVSEDEVLGVAEGAKYCISLSTDENSGVNANNINLSWNFKDGDAGLGNGAINIHPGVENDANRYQNSEGPSDIPAGAKSLVITIQTAGPQNIISETIDDDNYIRITKDSSAEDYLTSEILAGARQQNGDYSFTITLDDTITLIDIKIKIVAGSSQGGGDDPNQHNPTAAGKFQVRVTKGKGVPEDVTPTLGLKFDTEDNIVQYSPGNIDWLDIPDNATTVTIYVPEEFQKYFQNIQIFEHTIGEQNARELPDIFDSLRRNNFQHTININPEKSYTFAVIFSYTRSVSWSYRKDDKNRDNYVQNCKIYLLDEEGNPRELVDEAHDPGDKNYYTNDEFANYQLTIGQSYQFKLVPDKGYQIAGLNINGYTVAASEDPQKMGVFDFTMTDSNFHMNGVVEKIGTIQHVNSNSISGIKVGTLSTGTDETIDKNFDEDFGGSLMLEVSDEETTSQDYKDSSKYVNSADCTDDIKSLVADSTIDIDLEQVVAKEKVSDYAEYWEKPIKELEKEVEVTLDYAGNKDTTYKIAREHDGKIEILDAQYDRNKNKLTFKTDKFSEYTILKSTNTATTKVIVDSASGDDYVQGFFAKAFKATARVGGQMYTVEVDNESGKYVVNNIPTGEKVVVKLTSSDGWNKITDATLNDGSKNNGKSVKPTSAGEFTLDTKGKENGEVSLAVNTQPIEVFKIMDADDENALVAKSGTYTINYKDSFYAYVVRGSKLSGNSLVPNVLGNDKVSFYIDKNKTPVAAVADKITLTGGKLCSSGVGLDSPNKTITLKAVTDKNKTYSTKIKFTAPITKVTINGERVKDNVGSLSLLYDTKKSYSVSFSGNADLNSITANYVDGNTKGTEVDFATFDGKKLIVEPNLVINHCTPGEKKTFAFYEGTEKIGDKNYEITFVNPLEGKKPNVKANASLTTNQEIGLTLERPSKVSATEHMYYSVCLHAKETDLSAEELTKQRNVYITDVRYFIPANTKNVARSVAKSNLKDKEQGWPVEFRVEVEMCYMRSFELAGLLDVQGLSNEITAYTKDLIYETRLSLTKKAPSKIFTGQTNVPIAITKWQNATAVRGVETIQFINSYNQVCDVWQRGDTSAESYFSYNEETGLISFDTENRSSYVEPGKYTVNVIAIGGAGKPASASMTINVVPGIEDLALDCQKTVYKAFNKTSSLKVNVVYNKTWDYTVPNSKKVKWSIVKTDHTDFQPDDPLYGMVTVKNGTVTIAKGFNTSPIAADNKFVVKGEAADYEGNDAAPAYTEPIEITSVMLIPTTMLLRWPKEPSGYFYSDITQSSIKAGKKFTTSSVNGAEVYVLDQFGIPMDVTIKVSNNMILNGDNTVIVKTTGTNTITATTNDGTKKSKSIKFNTVYTDKYRNLDAKLVDCYDNDMLAGEPATDASGKRLVSNSLDSRNYIYFSVAGVDTKGNTAQIKHSFNVSGGSKIATYYNINLNYVTYEIQPNAHETILTVKDTTSGRKAITYAYKITNTRISDVKAPTIKGDKTKLYNNMTLVDVFVTGPDQIMNRVNYTINDAVKKYYGQALTVKVLRPDPYGGPDVIEYHDVTLDEKNGKFTLDFFKTDTDTLDMGDGEKEHTLYSTYYPEMKKYSFYVTVGKGKDADFEPLSKIQTLSLDLKKAPKPSATLSKKSFKMVATDNYQVDFTKPTIKDGYVIYYYRLSSGTNSGVNNLLPALCELDSETTPTKLTFGVPDDFYDCIYITKDKPVEVNSIDTLEQLRKGEYKVDGVLYGTAKQQKDAYNSWAKKNLNGYVYCVAIDYIGNYVEIYLPISIALVDKQK